MKFSLSYPTRDTLWQGNGIVHIRRCRLCGIHRIHRTYTLWAVNHEQYVLWSLRSLWFMDGDLVMGYQVHSTLLTHRAHSVQYTPAKCRGHDHQICLVAQDDCELTLVQGKPVTCKYNVAKSAPPHLEYLSSDVWLIAVIHCVNLTVLCPGLPPSDFAVCQPERWNISSKCIIEWPYGRTIPVGRRFLSVRPRYFARKRTRKTCFLRNKMGGSVK